jgi:single-strand DNA-binding protein
MENLNLIVIDGNLTADPEYKHVSSSSAVCNFTVANNLRSWSDKPDVSYFKVEVWGKPGEAAAQYLKKGSSVTVTGSMVQRSWQDQEGKRQYSWALRASNIRFNSKPSQSARLEDHASEDESP